MMLFYSIDDITDSKSVGPGKDQLESEHIIRDLGVSCIHHKYFYETKFHRIARLLKRLYPEETDENFSC